MCGLWGAIAAQTSLVSLEKERVRDLGIVSQLRGVHATGIIGISKKDRGGFNVLADKMGESASYYLYTSKAMEIFNTLQTVALIGHCRYATTGSLDDESAHPYVEKHIIGVHNGTINSLSHFKDRENKPLTDSHMLFKKIAENGLESTLNKIEISGAYAIVYVDTREKKIVFVRNSARPLWFMNHNDIRYWASEYDFLNMIRARSNIPLTNVTFELVKMETIYEYDLISKKWSERGLVKEKSADNDSAPWYTGSRHIPKKEEKKEEEKEEAKQIPIPLFKTVGYKGFRGKKMSVSKASKILSNGCSLCDAVADLDRTVFFFANKKFVCNKCYLDKHTLTQLSIGKLFRGTPIYEEATNV